MWKSLEAVTFTNCVVLHISSNLIKLFCTFVHQHIIQINSILCLEITIINCISFSIQFNRTYDRLLFCVVEGRTKLFGVFALLCLSIFVSNSNILADRCVFLSSYAYHVRVVQLLDIKSFDSLDWLLWLDLFAVSCCICLIVTIFWRSIISCCIVLHRIELFCMHIIYSKSAVFRHSSLLSKGAGTAWGINGVVVAVEVVCAQ